MIRHISATAYPILYKVAVASSIIPKHFLEKDHMTEDQTTKNSKRNVGQVLDIVGFVGREFNAMSRIVTKCWIVGGVGIQLIIAYMYVCF